MALLAQAGQLTRAAPLHHASHLTPYRAAPRLFEQLLAANPREIAGTPPGKVVIDFTDEGEDAAAFEPAS